MPASRFKSKRKWFENCIARPARIEIKINHKARKCSVFSFFVSISITIDGRRWDVSTSNYVEASRWGPGGKVKGNSEEARTVNMHLDILKQKAYEYRQEINLAGQPFAIDTFKQKWLGLGESNRTLLEVMRDHNSKLQQLIGKAYVKSTWVKYKTTEKHVEEFIRSNNWLQKDPFML